MGVSWSSPLVGCISVGEVVAQEVAVKVVVVGAVFVVVVVVAELARS